MNLHNKDLSKLPPLPEKFDCASNKLSSLSESPNYVNDNNCCLNQLTDLIGSPQKVVEDFYCSFNKLTTLYGSPKDVFDFDCSSNLLTDLIGSPTVGGYFCCDHNQLTSLFGMPKLIKGNLYIRNNPNLLDVSDIWDSDIGGSINFDLNPRVAILPLIKFKLLRCDNIMITSIHERHRGSSKQNIIDFQYDLIENGYEEHARWKP